MMGWPKRRHLTTSLNPTPHLMLQPSRHSKSPRFPAPFRALRNRNTLRTSSRPGTFPRDTPPTQRRCSSPYGTIGNVSHLAGNVACRCRSGWCRRASESGGAEVEACASCANEAGIEIGRFRRCPWDFVRQLRQQASTWDGYCSPGCADWFFGGLVRWWWVGGKDPSVDGVVSVSTGFRLNWFSEAFVQVMTAVRNNHLRKCPWGRIGEATDVFSLYFVFF